MVYKSIKLGNMDSSLSEKENKMKNQNINKAVNQIEDIKLLAKWILEETEGMKKEVHLGRFSKKVSADVKESGRKVARWTAELNEMVQSLNGEVLGAE